MLDGEKSIREELESAVAVHSETTESTQGSEPTAGKAPVTSDAKSTATPDDGKSAAAAAFADPAKKPVAAADPKTAADAAPKPLDPPARWTKTQKEWFVGLSPEFQKQLLENDKHVAADYTKKTMEAAELRNRYSSIEALLAPRRQTWQQQGLDDPRALNMMFSYWDLAQRDPMAFINQFAQERRIDLASQFKPTPQQIASWLQEAGIGDEGQPQPATVHPVVQRELDALKQQLTQAHQQIGQLSGAHQQRAQAEQQGMVQSLSAELDAFRTKADSNGASLHPFFDEVRVEMARLMKADLAKDLTEAYEKAVRLNPTVSAKLEESREITRRRDDEQRKAAEAAAAKRAGASVSPSAVDYTPSASKSDDSLSLRDMLSQQFANARAGSRI